MMRSRLPFFMQSESHTLNRSFFQALDFADPPQTVLPRTDQIGEGKLKLIDGKLVDPQPGQLIRFMSKRLPVRFDPFNRDHVEAWQQFAVHGRAMPIQFILEGMFETVPEMIMYKMSMIKPVAAKSTNTKRVVKRYSPKAK